MCDYDYTESDIMGVRNLPINKPDYHGPACGCDKCLGRGKYDPQIYSGTWIGNMNGPPMTWKELCEVRDQELRKLHAWQRMVTDLDRNENGRHEGDADVGDPSGISQGNPKLKTGDVLGYDIGGNPYTMPPRGQRYDPRAWGARE